MMGKIDVRIENRVAVVAYSNPPVNATDSRDYDEFTRIFRELDQRSDISAVVLCTEGKGFMAGNDIKELKTHTPEGHAAYQQRLIDAFESICDCRHPVIGAVQGYALGAGFVFAACCDMVVASEDAYFALPEITLAVISGVGYALKMLPECAARYICLTGKPLGAKEMLNFGAVNRVVSRDKLMEETMEIAGNIAKLPPNTVTCMKELLNQHCNNEHRRKFKLEDAYTGRLFGLPEKQEAVNAFLEKREPNYKS
ncbi:MAG: enoyl-CoA hydratase/isomerase family protein [Lachnospiraceae bacterium]|nr:enoyl-CoA hydratase/isomerase family protein [Lachnospiraceae bacterium]